MLEGQGLQGRERKSGEGRRKGKTKKEAGVRFLGGWGALGQLSGAIQKETLLGNHQSPQAYRPLPTAGLNLCKKGEARSSQ